MRAALAEPLLEMLPGGRAELREEESGAPLIAGPDHVGVALQLESGAGQHAAKREVRADGHRLGGLQGEAVLADVDADAGERARLVLDIDQRFHFKARGLAA